MGGRYFIGVNRDIEPRPEGVMQVSGGRGKSKHKGPGAGKVLLGWRKKQRPVQLEQKAQGGAGVEVGKVSGNLILQHLQTMVGALTFMPKWKSIGRF